MRIRTPRLLLTASFCLTVAVDAQTQEHAAIRYGRDVRPLLSDRCFSCHGPDEASRKAGLRLDQPSTATTRDASGTSEFERRIRARDSKERMPPAHTNKTLSEQEMQVLAAWIDQGAEYEMHWAFVAPEKTAVPAIRSGPNRSWTRGAIDAFISKKLEEEGLQPSPEADRHTLVRRLYLDLLGYAPTPEEADEFVNDDREGAYERLVDRLLASPHYGERFARRWLDLARYADTNGYEKDRPRTIWPYRDWVVRALNADLPYDEFTAQQLAGDLLEHPTQDQLIATGFHRNTMLNEEGGIDPLEFRYHAVADRVATTGKTWLGLTLECAQCHTHKYDPITQREYYQLFAFFNNADEPTLRLTSEAWRAEARSKEQAYHTELLALMDHWPDPSEPFEWQVMIPGSARATNGSTARIQPDGSVLLNAKGPEREDLVLTYDHEARAITHLRLEALADDSLPSRGPGRTGHGNFVLTRIRVETRPRDTPNAPFVTRLLRAESADHEQPGFPVANALRDSPNTGWAVGGAELGQDRNAIFAFVEPIENPHGTSFRVTLEGRYGSHHTIGRPRVSVAARTPREPQANRERAEQAFEEWYWTARVSQAPWQVARPTAMRSNLPILQQEPDGSIYVFGDTTKQDWYELTFALGPREIRALRLEALPDARLPAGGPGLTYYEGRAGLFFLTEIELHAGTEPHGKAERITIDRAASSFAGPAFTRKAPIAKTFDGDIQTGWGPGNRIGERHVAVFVLAQPIQLEAGESLTLKLFFGRHYASSLGRFRIAFTDRDHDLAPEAFPTELLELLVKERGQLHPEERERLLLGFLKRAKPIEARVQDLRERHAPRKATETLVFAERTPAHKRHTFRHHRGEYTAPREEVHAAVPAFLPPLSGEPEQASEDRLALARWLTAPEHPLTARVAVNRAWHTFFGRGIVTTLDDLGHQGSLPTHPRLLDWLARRLIENGWSMKTLHKQIVMSATYRQSSHVRREPDEHRKAARLFARLPRPRLEAEILRDSILRASGLLQANLYGPPVKPPQPSGVTELAYGSGAWKADRGEKRYRRSLYTFQKRTAPFAMYQAFDAPSGEACVAQRDVSNSPLQALTLLNDEMFLEAARAFGRHVTNRAFTNDRDRIEYAFRRVLTRLPTPREQSRLQAFLDEQRERLQAGQLDVRALGGKPQELAQESAAFAILGRVLFSLDETLTRN